MGVWGTELRDTRGTRKRASDVRVHNCVREPRGNHTDPQAAPNPPPGGTAHRVGRRRTSRRVANPTQVGAMLTER